MENFQKQFKWIFKTGQFGVSTLNESHTNAIQGMGNHEQYLEVVDWEELRGEGKWNGEVGLVDGVDVRVVVGVVDGEKVEQGGSGSELSISGIILEKEHNWLNSLM